jgi:hypothetical protein
MRYVISHFNYNDDVKILVSSAPATFPKLPLDYHTPMMVPLPFLPNQLAKIALQHGQPPDCKNPLIENSTENTIGLVQLYSAHMDITVVIPVTAI